MAKVYYKAVSSDNYLAHHGIIGQKWGVRRYQNPDGTLTDLGRKRLSKYSEKYDKANENAARAKSKVKPYLTDFGKHKNEKALEKSARYEDKARRTAAKAMRDVYDKKYTKSEKLNGTAEDDFKKVIESVKNVKVSDIKDTDDNMLSKLYADLDRIKKSGDEELIELVEMEIADYNSMFNKPMSIDKLKVDEYGTKEAPVSVPKKFGGMNVDYPNTEISFHGDKLDQNAVNRAYATLDEFIKDFNGDSKIVNEMKEAIYKDVKPYIEEWDAPANKEEFCGNIKTINSLSFMNYETPSSKERLTDTSIYFDDGEMFGGHVFAVDYNLDHRKITNVSMEG